MNLFGLTKSDNSKDIYFYRPDLPTIDTAKKFNITSEEGKLRVKNKNINCLFSNLTAVQFDKSYNDFIHYLNLDFEPATIGSKEYSLAEEEREQLTEKIITSWIYYYTVNNFTVEVKRSDFTHPYMVDYVLSILDKKYGADTLAALTLGAKILRQGLTEYSKTVKGRRHYYDR
jgi:hypothetical protein